MTTVRERLAEVQEERKRWTRERAVDAAVKEGLRRASVSPEAWGLDVPWTLDVSGVFGVVVAVWRETHP